MITEKLLNPSPFKDAGDIEIWLHDMQIWQCVTNLDEKQQGPVLYLLLPDKVRNSFKVVDLNKNDGPLLLINKLEKLYVKDNKTSIYLAYEKLDLFQRTLVWFIIQMSLNNYTMTFRSMIWIYHQLF